jgi:hypothetical protein
MTSRSLLFVAVLLATASGSAATFPDAHEPPPAGWTGPVFKLSQAYPSTLPPPEKYPWKAYDFATQPEQYIKAVLAYALDGNVSTSWHAYDNATRIWYHAPWMHYGDSGREFIHGMTRERNSRPKELAPTQTCYWQNWAVGFYNAPGGYIIGDVWKNPKTPDATKAIFPDGTVSIKLLFTAAPQTQVPYLKNGFQWQGNIDPLTGACTAADPTGTRTPAIMTLLQIDLAVRDTRANATTGWVFGTFVYDGTAPGATPWERMIPVGVQWGNDPLLTPVEYAKGTRVTESWINPSLTIPQHLGWLGRLNGPVDNPLSSCLSCHGTAQNPDASPMIPPNGSTDAQRMRWFRNVKATEAFDLGKATSLDYSLQLALGILNQQTAVQQVTPAVDNGIVTMQTKQGTPIFPVTREEGVNPAEQLAQAEQTIATTATGAKPERQTAREIVSTSPNATLAIVLAGIAGILLGMVIMLVRQGWRFRPPPSK